MQRGSLKVWKNRRGVKMWRGQWRENGRGRTKLFGEYSKVSRADARAELDKTLAPLNARQQGRASAVTLRRFVEDQYLISKARRWKLSTKATTEQIIETHILRDLGARTLVSLDRSALQAHLDGRAASGLSYSVVAHIHWQLVAIFRMAAADGLITLDPAKGLDTPKCKAAPEKRLMDISAIEKAQMVLDLRDRIIFRLALCEGMRPGEIVGLQTGDYRDEMFHIERRIYRGVVDTPKSRRGNREVPLTETTQRLLKEWLNLTNPAPVAWLFPSEAGSTPLSYANVYRRRIQPALESVGLGKINFQVLRRTWVSEFSKTEPDSKIRAQIGGHSVDVHENTYRQVKPDVMKKAMKKLGKHLQ